jgi:hypothetical protein
MTRKSKVVVRVGLVVLVVVLLVNWFGRRRQYRTIASAEAKLVIAGVTPGVAADRVVAVLDSLGAEHSSLNSEGVLSAQLGRSFEDGFVRGDLFAEFRFDSTGHLKSRLVREQLTGP